MAFTRTGASFRRRHATTAEKLKGAGYNTAAFVSAFVLAGRFGLSRGFDVYDDRLAGRRGANDPPSRQPSACWRISPTPDGAPQFVWVHFSDSHVPDAAAGAIPKSISRAAIPG